MSRSAHDSRLTSASFHPEFVRAMQAASFVRLYYFTATTRHDAYHVPTDFARETTHFFMLPDQGFVLKLAHSEDIDERGRYSQWWSGTVKAQLDIREMIAYEVYFACRGHRDAPYAFSDCVPLSHVLGNIDPTAASDLFYPFRHASGLTGVDDSGSAEWSFEHTGGLPVAELVNFADGLRTHFGPFLQAKFAGDFNAFGFTNDYAWPGISKCFWRGFPSQLLKSRVTGRVHGRKSVPVPTS